MSENGPMPLEILDAAHRKLCRRVAAMIIHGMAETDVSFETIDARLGHKPGFSKRFLNSLMTGRTDTLRIVSDLSVALGVEPSLSLELPFTPPEPLSTTLPTVREE